MRRYPVLTAVALGLLVGVIGIVVLAVADVDNDDGAEGPRPVVDTSVLPTRRPSSTEVPGRPGAVSAGSAGHSCASRSGSRNGQTVQLDLCVQPTTVSVGQTVRFVASAAPCDATLDFGDGHSSVVAAGPGKGDTPYAYAQPGRFTARLSAAGCGSTGEIAVTVTVT